MEVTGGTSISLTKWQIALVFGAPLALGLGYMYYRNFDKADKKPDRCKIKKIPWPKDSNKDNITESNENSFKTPLEQAEFYKKKGNGFFSLGKFDEAISNYKLAIDTCPKENSEELATFYQNRAAAYEKLQNTNSVIDDCTKALELQPKYVKALLRRARALEFANDLENALEDVTVAYFLENFSNQSTANTAENILNKLSAKHTQEYLATKKPVMPSKYFINACLSTYYNDPIQKELKNPLLDDSTPYNKALLALKMQKYDDIIPLCLEELNDPHRNISPLQKLKVISLMSSFYFILGKYDEAVKGFTEIINSKENAPDLKVTALIKRANIYLQLEDSNKSFEDFATAINIDPDCGDIYHNRGQVNLLLENHEKARNDFHKSVELNPDFGITYAQKCFADYSFAKSIFDINLMNTAISSFKEAMDKFPDCAECYTLYGQILLNNKEFEKANEYFMESLKRDPDNSAIYVHRGLVCINWKNDIDKATELIKKAIEIDEKCEYAYHVLGSIEVQRGNLKDAISLFNKAIPLVRSTAELTHTITLRNITKSQLAVSERLGMNVDKLFQNLM